MIYCATRLAPSDKFIYNHFFDYYKNELGIQKFFINFNYKLGHEKEFNIFIDNVLKDYGKDIVYNIGPNGPDVAETANISRIKELVKIHTSDKDFILTADSDELHFIPIDLKDIDSFDFDYIGGTTLERVASDFSVDHSLSKIKNYKELFKTFNFNLPKFRKPKISLSRKNLFIDGVTVGHHGISKKELREKSKQYPIPSQVNHFKWHKEGVGQMQFWNKLWSSEEYHGWKGSRDEHINVARNALRNGSIFIVNKIDADLKNEFNFEFDYSIKEKSLKNGFNIYIHIVNESDVYSMNNSLYRQFQNYNPLDSLQMFCYKSNSQIKFANQLDLYFFNNFYK